MPEITNLMLQECTHAAHLDSVMIERILKQEENIHPTWIFDQNHSNALDYLEAQDKKLIFMQKEVRKQTIGLDRLTEYDKQMNFMMKLRSKYYINKSSPPKKPTLKETEELHKCTRYLRYFYRQINVDSTLKRLFKDLSEAFLEEGDAAYVDTRKYDFTDCQLLKLTPLVVTHKSDENKIKLLENHAIFN